jgi:hypothetical protein
MAILININIIIFNYFFWGPDCCFATLFLLPFYLSRGRKKKKEKKKKSKRKSKSPSNLVSANT